MTLSEAQETKLTRRCCIRFKALLELVVSELNEGVVLFRQFQGKHAVVLLANLCFALFQHSFADQAHLRDRQFNESLAEFCTRFGG